MSVIDLDELLKEISPDQPCGENLEYDPALQELETLVQGKPETQFGEAEEPDWRDIRNKSTEIFARTKDLRVTLHLSLALLQMEGIPGLRDGLSLMLALLEKYWDQVHPTVDPDDPEDYLERVNVIASIAVTTFGDPYKFLARLREAPLCNSRQFGRFGLRDLQLAKGDLSLPEGSDAAPPQLAAISAAFQDTDLEELKETAAALQESLECVNKIDQLVTERTGASQAPDLSGLEKAFSEILNQTQEFLPSAASADGGPEQAGAEEAGSSDAPAVAAAPRISGEITSREDVVTALEKIDKYYQQCEPGSPVPFLLQWAKRLVDKNFLEIIEDLSQDGLEQFRTIVGVKVDSDDD